MILLICQYRNVKNIRTLEIFENNRGCSVARRPVKFTRIPETDKPEVVPAESPVIFSPASVFSSGGTIVCLANYSREGIGSGIRELPITAK